MFFKKTINYKIIENIEVKQLQQFCQENSIYININDNSTEWASFANYYARKHNFNPFKAGSFSYIISMFLSPMGVSCRTEIYYREENIEMMFLKELEELFEKYSDETIIAKTLFYKIFEFYNSEDFEDYCYKKQRVDVKLSVDMYFELDDVAGDNISDKIRTLIKEYKHNKKYTD